MSLEQLQAEASIRELIPRYSRAVDRWDMDLLRTCYHPGAADNHGSFVGPVEEYVPWVATLGAGRHQWGWHFPGTLAVEVEDDASAAWAETYCLSIWRMHSEEGKPERHRVVPIRYCDRHEPRDGVWRIADRVVAYQEGRIAPIAKESPLTDEHLRGCTGRGDPLYARGHEPARDAQPTRTLEQLLDE